MTFEDALKILGLNPDYTDEELKTAWRKLSKENHPDKHHDAEKMSEKQALINAARDYLKNYKGPRLKSTPKFDLSEYINQKIDELEGILKGSSSFSGELKQAAEGLEKIIRVFKMDMLLAYNLTKEDVDKEFRKCKQIIKYKFDMYLVEFYRKYDIFEKDVKETINYECSLLEFHNQLLKIKEKYSKEVITRKILEKEVEKYKEYAGYNRVATLIDVCKNYAMNNIKQNQYKNIESEISKMHNQILTEVFETYYSIKKKITDLETIVKDIYDGEIDQLLEEIKEAFENGQNFNDTEKSIQELEEKIQKWKEEQMKEHRYKENMETINQIYQSLIERYSLALKKLNNINELEKAQDLSNLIKVVLQYFIQGCQEFKGIDYFEQFNEITFKNHANDYKIIDKLIIGDKIKKSNVYFKRKDDQYIFDMNSFYYYDEIANKMYKIYHGDVSQRFISKERLEEEYISLEEFLDNAEFVGEFIKYSGSIVKCLYKDSVHILYLLNETYFLATPKTFHFFTTSLDDSRKGSGIFKAYKDKEYICTQLKEQLRALVDDYNDRLSWRESKEPLYNKINNNNIFISPQEKYNILHNKYFDENGKPRRKI